jgi:hypothetical protein
MTLTQEERDAIREYCHDTGNTFQKNYSGRNMYGKDCFGYITETPILQSFGDFLLNMAMLCPDEDLTDFIDCVKYDSFGKSASIIYFPNIQWGEEEDCEEDEED